MNFQLLSALSPITLVLIPGVMLIFLLFRQEKLYWKMAVGLVFSIIILGYMILLLSHVPGLGVTKSSILYSFGLLNLLILLCGIWQNKQSLINIFTGCENRRIRLLQPIKDNGPLILSLIVLLIFLLALPGTLSIRKESYTEFYVITDPKVDLPWSQNSKDSKVLQVNIGLTSHELRDSQFLIWVVTNGQVIDTYDLGMVSINETISKNIFIVPTSTERQLYRIVLYKVGEVDPYRELNFWAGPF